ncbi:MAG: hypothetical protein ACLUW6_05070 [Coriobacteriaceae bacterium]
METVFVIAALKLVGYGLATIGPASASASPATAAAWAPPPARVGGRLF